MSLKYKKKSNIIPFFFKPYISFIFIFLSDLKSNIWNAKALNQCTYILN
jgi:hypothetical protein